MAIKRSVNTTNNPSLGPKFNFYQYDVKPNREPFYNNDADVDFVTYNGSLYVCVEDRTPFLGGNPSDHGFLLLVEKGQQGRDGVNGERGPKGEEPDYQLRFDGKQLVISDEHGVRKAVSPNLTGPVWFPERRGDYLRWVRKAYDDGSVPEDINLEDLRSVEEHPVLFRLNSDNTKRSDEESGPGYYIQWKKEGQEEWTNLMSISELMNIALAGVSFWDQEDPDGIHRIHFGHRQVKKATYDSDALGNKRIAEVELGEVLFDAGAVPYPDYYTDIEALQVFLCDIQSQINDLNLDGVVRSVNGIVPDCNGNVTISTPASDLSGVVKSVSVNNGSKISPDSTGNVNLTIQGGSGSGSTVSVERVLNSGTKIATITVDNNATDLYAPNNGGGGSGGGSTVSVNRILNSGTPIASITVDNSSTTLYAPNAGGIGTIQFRVNNGHLEYKIDNGSWEDAGSLPSGSTPADLNNLKLRIETINNKKYLQISRDGGSNWGEDMELPSGSDSGDGLTEDDVRRLINLALANYYTKDDVYNKQEINNLLSGEDSTITIEARNTFTIYKWYQTGSNPVSPSLPTSASWDGTSNGFVINGNSANWTEHPGNKPADNYHLWIAQITLLSDNVAKSDWIGPIDLTGAPGEDGAGVEFIYRLCVDRDEYESLSTPVAPSYGPDSYPAGWTDNPQGIGIHIENGQEVFYKVEAASVRTSRNGVWGSYCSPFIWAMWGEDGIDGDGIEYIFYLADESEVTSLKLNSSHYPVNSWAYDDPQNGWSDEPSGVSEDYPYEFASVRRYTVNPQTRVGSWSNWSKPSLWSIYKEGPQGPTGPDGVSILDQTRYYKADSSSTGVSAPNIDSDPTLSANGGWSTSSNSMILTENEPYLWFFERIVYSNGRKWQSDPVVIRYFNAAVNVDYQEIIDNVLGEIDDDLNALDERLSTIVDTNGEIITDPDLGIINALTSYRGEDQTSFADMILNAQEAKVKSWAGSAVESGVGRTLTSVKNELDGIDGKISTAATQARQGAVSDARTEWSAADASITSTVTNATYVWVNNTDGSMLPYNGETSKAGYTKTLIADEMSALKQTSDAVSVIVGQDGQVSADLIISTINGGTAQIDANHIILNGEVIANAIQSAEISADQITSGTINANRIAANSIDASKINAQNLRVSSANIDGTLSANQINLSGKTISDWNELGVVTGGINIYIGNADDSGIPNDSLIFTV